MDTNYLSDLKTVRLVKFAFPWGSVKKIRGPKQKFPSKAKSSLFVPFFSFCVDFKMIAAPLLLEWAQWFSHLNQGDKAKEAHILQILRTKHKEKNAKCALYRCLSFNRRRAG